MAEVRGDDRRDAYTDDTAWRRFERVPNPILLNLGQGRLVPAISMPPDLGRPTQTLLWLAATFWWAFFCRRGKRDLSFFCSFGIFVDFVCGGVGAGSATPASDAILPAAAPMIFAAVAKVLSLASGSTGFLRSLGFFSSAMISSGWR